MFIFFTKLNFLVGEEKMSYKNKKASIVRSKLSLFGKFKILLAHTITRLNT